MRLGNLVMLKMSMLVFLVVTTCGFAGIYQRDRGTYCLYLHPEDAGSMVFTTKKTSIDIISDTCKIIDSISIRSK
jgi:hypothetical protein